jgi:hypothetical protein
LNVGQEVISMPEHRSEPRAKADSEVIVKIQSVPGVPDLEGRIFACHAKDVSFNGMQLYIDIEIPCGALLELEIVFIHSSERYWHTGYVVWYDDWMEDSPDQENRFSIGIRFETITNPQSSSWRSAVSQLLEMHKTGS